ncbi:hypothetical protein [Acerihabitans arboris]|uniref:hypothetical protein n=1 Tax=Acerihabitans arboris TaxID=2691583 RepID=UPI0015B75546|nr:hypothetical protein [Acerihabitans arboris]
MAINPEEGYFIINFGSSIEILTESFTNKVHANVHGVVQTYRSDEQGRHSYAMFLDSDISGDVYRDLPNPGPIWIQSMAEFA